MNKNMGFTMVELVVALALSSIVSVAMLMFFKHSMYISLDSRTAIEIDTKVQTAIITIKKLVQNAGFGTGQYGDIEVGTFESNPALLWRQLITVDNNDAICRGIGEKIDADGLHRILFLKKSPCATNDHVESGDWQEDQQLASFITTRADPIITYELNSNAGCNPFGISSANGEGKKTLIIEAISDADALASEGANEIPYKKTSIKLCLLNITEDAPLVPAP